MATEYRLSHTAAEIDEKLIKVDVLDEALKTKQDNLTFDSAPIEDSENPITSGGVYEAIQNAKPNLTYDEVPTEGSSNLVTSGAVYAALANNSTATDDDALMDFMAEMELVDPVTLSDGSILISNNNEIYSL